MDKFSLAILVSFPVIMLALPFVYGGYLLALFMITYIICMGIEIANVLESLDPNSDKNLQKLKRRFATELYIRTSHMNSEEYIAYLKQLKQSLQNKNRD